MLYDCILDELLKVLNRFYKRKEMQKLAADHGLDGEKIISQLLLQCSKCKLISTHSVQYS